MWSLIFSTHFLAPNIWKCSPFKNDNNDINDHWTMLHLNSANIFAKLRELAVFLSAKWEKKQNKADATFLQASLSY